jgi:hypothetical protein
MWSICSSVTAPFSVDTRRSSRRRLLYVCIVLVPKKIQRADMPFLFAFVF